MPIIYFEKKILRDTESRHPALEVNEKHPCYRMVREAIDGKSVFHWTRDQAYRMYEWYCTGWRAVYIIDEFGDEIPDYTFRDLLKTSHYLTNVRKKEVSGENIEALWSAIEMEKKLLEDSARGETEEE